MKNISICVVASLMKGLGMSDRNVEEVFEYSSVTELIEDKLASKSAKVIVHLLEHDLLTDALFSKIKEIIGEYEYSMGTSLSHLRIANNGSTYLVFYLDFDEHYDFLYLDVNTFEMWTTQSAFIDYLLSK